MGVKRPFSEHLRGSEIVNDSKVLSDDDLSSDDSLDIDRATSQPPPSEVPNQKYGIGADLMAKMGYTAGSGLGASGSGIVNPVEVEKRQKRAGLGVEVPEQFVAKTSPSTADQLDSKLGSSNMAELRAVIAELDHIRQQQNVLQQAVQMIKNGQQDLDIQKFHALFGNEPLWYTERLYDAAAAVIRSQIPQVKAFEWLMDNPAVLLNANQVLPDEEWGIILAETWLVESVHDLPLLLDQWVLGRSAGFAAAGRYLSQLFTSSEVVAQAVSQSQFFLSRLIDALPDASGLITEIKRSFTSYPFESQLAVLASIPIDTADIAKLVLTSPILSGQTRVLTALSKVLSVDILSSVLEKTRVREQWLNELSDRLNKPDPESLLKLKQWWIEWRPFFNMFRDDIVEPWLKAGLDAINGVLDGTHQPGDKKAAVVQYPSHPRLQLISTLRDVLEHVCYMNEFIFESTPSGYVVKSGQRELEIMIENDVIYVRQSQALVPISVDVLQSYLSKP